MAGANAAVKIRRAQTAMTAAAAARTSPGLVAVPVMTVTAKAAAMSAMRREPVANAAVTEQAARAAHAPVKVVMAAVRAVPKNSVSVSTVLRDSALSSVSNAMKSCKENPRNAGSAENYAAAARPI